MKILTRRVAVQTGLGPPFVSALRAFLAASGSYSYACLLQNYANVWCVDIFIRSYIKLVITDDILASPSENVLSSMRKMRRFRSSCACAKYHPGLWSPFIHSVVSNDSGSGK